MTERLNNCTNLIALLMVLVAAALAETHQLELAHELVAGALGLLTGAKLTHPNEPAA